MCIKFMLAVLISLVTDSIHVGLIALLIGELLFD